MWNLAEGGYRYRPLRAGVTGWDVSALQSALRIKRDGAFGEGTESIVIAYQRATFDDPDDHDGIAGVKTQRALALRDLWPEQKLYRLPPGLARGVLEGEANFWHGNHSLTYQRRNQAGALVDKKDIGVAQFQTELSDLAALGRAFDVPLSIHRLCERLRQQHDRYFATARVTTHEQAWRLAVGSWNAPAYSDWIAGLSSRPVPSVDSLAALDAYIEDKVVYVKEWSP